MNTQMLGARRRDVNSDIVNSSTHAPEATHTHTDHTHRNSAARVLTSCRVYELAASSVTAQNELVQSLSNVS